MEILAFLIMMAIFIGLPLIGTMIRVVNPI